MIESKIVTVTDCSVYTKLIGRPLQPRQVAIAFKAFHISVRTFIRVFVYFSLILFFNLIHSDLSITVFAHRMYLCLDSFVELFVS